MNNLNISEAFRDVNETYPTIGRTGMIMGQFAAAGSCNLHAQTHDADYTRTNDI